MGLSSFFSDLYESLAVTEVHAEAPSEDKSAAKNESTGDDSKKASADKEEPEEEAAEEEEEEEEEPEDIKPKLEAGELRMPVFPDKANLTG